jgi:hypothetical protein
MAKKRLRARLKQEEIEIELPDGKVAEWVVKELTGPQRDAYMETRSQNFSHGKQGEVTGIKSYMGIVTNLLQFCVYDAATGVQVTVGQLNELPSSTQQELFDIAVSLSGIKPDDKKEAGAELNPTTQNESAGEPSPAT